MTVEILGREELRSIQAFFDERRAGSATPNRASLGTVASSVCFQFDAPVGTQKGAGRVVSLIGDLCPAAGHHLHGVCSLIGAATEPESSRLAGLFVAEHHQTRLLDNRKTRLPASTWLIASHV
jgi:hypothetical protein